MKARAVLATVALVTAVAAVVGAPALADRARPAKHPSTAVESCATQSGAEFPHAFASRRNLVVGPLSVTGAGGSPAFVWNSHGTEGFQKFPLLVREGHRVKLELSAKSRGGVGLAYGPLPQGETYLRDTYRVVTFVPCRHGQDSWSSADGQSVTFWSGSSLLGHHDAFHFSSGWMASPSGHHPARYPPLRLRANCRVMAEAGGHQYLLARRSPAR